MAQPLEKLSLASVQFSAGRSHIKATTESLSKEVQSQRDGELTAFSLQKRSQVQDKNFYPSASVTTTVPNN